MFIQLIRSRKKKTKPNSGIRSPAESQTEVANVTVKNEHSDIKEVTAKTSKSRIPVPIQNKELVEVETQLTKTTDELEQSDEVLTGTTQLVAIKIKISYIL